MYSMVHKCDMEFLKVSVDVVEVSENEKYRRSKKVADV